MRNEFTMVIEQDGEWFIGTVQKYLALTGRGGRLKNVVRI